MRLSSLGPIAIAPVLLTISVTALADTYHVFDLGIANATGVYGIDSSGIAVTRDNSTGVYSLFDNGAFIGTSLTAPVLNYDNGTPCTPTVSAGIIWSGLGQAKCNSGHEVYVGLYGPSMSTRGIFTGPNLSDLLHNPFFNLAVIDELALNASGDFAWTDGGAEENFEAVDVTTDVPEPGNILLFGTGALGLLTWIRRRVIRAS